MKRDISDCLSPCGFSTQSKGIKTLNSEKSGGKMPMGANKKIVSTEDNFKNNFPHGNTPPRI